MPPVIAIDAMGGDRAPEEIVTGAVTAVTECDVDIVLVGDRGAIEPLLPGGKVPSRVEILETTEVIGMHEEPAAAVRAKKDSSIVRAAEAVRDGRADAMVGAGNTGATMAAALLRYGRIKGIHRPAIALPIPVLNEDRVQLLVDGGATVDPEPEWLVEWAEQARAYARIRLGITEPSIALLSNGEEAGKGDALRKRASELFGDVKGFIGNVEGRDLMARSADIIITDGFTGNVALKTLEGALLGLAGLVFAVIDRPGAPWATDADALKLELLGAATRLLPDNTGGGLLLGLNGVCIISHGSSSATAIVNAVRVARDSSTRVSCARLREAVPGAG